MSARWGRQTSRIGLALLYLLALLPFLLCLGFQAAYAVDVPVWDEWRVVLMLSKVYDGTLTAGDLFAHHNEHIAAVPYLITLALGLMTSYNTVVFMYLSTLSIAAMGVVLYLHTRPVSRTRTASILAFLPVSWILFNLRGWENLLLGIGLALMLANLFAILTFYYLDKTQSIDVLFLGAIIWATLASFSFAHGLLVWPIGFVHLLVSRGGWTTWSGSRGFWLKPMIWLLASVAVYTFYFGTLSPGGLGTYGPASRARMLEDPAQALLYVLTLLGAPLAWEGAPARVAGAVLCACLFATLVLAWRYRPQLSRGYGVPILMIVFAGLSVVAFTSGRMIRGVDQALQSRYVPVTSLAIVGIYLVLLWLRASNLRFARYLPACFVGLVSIGLLPSYVRGDADGQLTRAHRVTAAYYLSTFDVQSDANLRAVIPDASLVRSLAPVLRAHRLTVFRARPIEAEELTISPEWTSGEVESVNGVPAGLPGARIVADPGRDETLKITGWAIDGPARRPAAGVMLRVGDRLTVPALYGEERPDIGRALNQPGLSASGFTAAFSTRALGPGTYPLVVLAVAADESQAYQVGQELLVDVR